MNITKDDWIRMYNEEYIGKSLSLPMLANKYHCGTTTIHRNFTKNNLKCRSHSEKSRKYKCNYYYFDNIDCEEKAYFLGLIYSDGYITGNAFGIALKSNDIEILEKLALCMSSTHKIKIYRNNGYGSYHNPTEYCRLIIKNQHLVDSLIKNGVEYHKSLKLKPPKLDDYLIRHFIRGFMDGDGSIYESCKSYTVSFTGVPEMLNYIGDHIKSKGIIKRYKLYPEHMSDVTYSLKIGGNIQSKNLLLYLYDNSKIYLKRKHDIYLHINN